MSIEVIAQAVTVLIPVIVPVIVAAVKKVVPSIPTLILPIFAVTLGVGIDYLNEVATGGGIGLIWGAALGAAAVGLREIQDQFKKTIA